jgi:hypothetical protein
MTWSIQQLRIISGDGSDKRVCGWLCLQVMEHVFWFVDHLEQYNANSMIPKDKPTERPAGWHPGPHGHEFRGQLLAHGYLKVLERALRCGGKTSVATIK